MYNDYHIICDANEINGKIWNNNKKKAWNRGRFYGLLAESYWSTVIIVPAVLSKRWSLHFLNEVLFSSFSSFRTRLELNHQLTKHGTLIKETLEIREKSHTVYPDEKPEVWAEQRDKTEEVQQNFILLFPIEWCAKHEIILQKIINLWILDYYHVGLWIIR